MREIHNKSLGKMKIKMGMPSELKALIRNRTHLILKHGVLYKKARVNARTKQLLVVPQSYRQRAMDGCHDQVGHLGQDRVLDLLRDRFYWPGMHADVVSYINSCPRCLRRKSQQDKAPLMNIETSQPLELIHLDYLKIEPSKGNIENVLVITTTLPLQGRLRQEGETVGEGVTDSEEEEEEKAVTPWVARAPEGGPTNTIVPQDDLTPVV